MRNLKELFRIVSLSRCKPFELPSTIQASRHCYSSWIPSDYVKTCTIRFKYHNLFMQKDDFVEKILLSRSISASTITCAKSKDRGGGKEKRKPKASKLDLRELGELLDVDDLTSQMSQAIENMKADFIKNLTLRSTTGSLEQIPVKVDDKEYQIQELAQIARKPKLIILNVSSFPTAIPHILKAIQKSGLNINPQQEGTTLYLPIPKVTKEHRENLSKNAKAIYIRYRDEIKDIRSKAIKNLKKRKDVSEDSIRRVQSQVEALSDKYVKEAEIVLETKQNELLGSMD
ncbi:ribosome-recycling factor, mitochondrial isoform X1 [Nasonia vitripennis]|uniref:Ribosome-recycling factor, mitochondrial n=2 Tax=Nasonia vitripennis TaxID=7425 RepID=A0A7M7G3N5_NASVI|nr:ribosome-recycling factor, mitochondrial isoform X1 [Nasonia vitripennis]